MCLLEPKEEVMKFQTFKFWNLPIERLLHSASKKSQKVLVIVVFSLLSLLFELKQTFFGSTAIPWNELLTTKKDGITSEVYGKNN